LNKMPGSQWGATETQASAREHLLVPAEEMAKLGQSQKPLLAYGDGIYVVDSEGRRLIDGPGGMWCTQIGYNRREIADALAEQALRLCYNSPWYTINSPASELAERIAKETPGDLNRVFFTTGGSTAVDTALRFSEYYNNVLGRPEKKQIIVRREGYHGSTSLTAACSGRAGNWPNFDIASERITFISSPRFRPAKSLSEAEFLDELVQEFEQTIERIGPEKVAVFLAEPLLASGGVIIPPQGYHARMKGVCERHDIIYVSDEVVTGFGRCGEWFASEAVFGVVPDIITFAKGVTSGYVPLGGLAISEQLLARVSGANAKGGFFTNGYTYSGHPVSCAAAIANMDVIEKDGILEHVRELAPYFAERLNELKTLPCVVDVRASGLVGCVECMLDPDADEPTALDKRLGSLIDKHCFELGLIVRPLGNMCVMSPPLVITREEVDTMVDILRQGIVLATEDMRTSG
jgi:putrescine---pyruvate transaminase